MQRRSLFQALFAAGVGTLALPALANDPRHGPPPPVRHPDPRARPPQPVPPQRYYNARGPAFVRGRRLPTEFRGRYYVVTDYWRYRLPRPARYQQWVQVGPDFVLTVAATGVIVSVVLGN